MTKRIVGASVLLAFCGLLVWGGHRLSRSRTYQLVGELITRVETSDSVVALTFDDGPVPAYTDSILAVLAQFDAPATFFMIGSAIQRHPAIAARVLEQGHEIGNHSYNHPQLILKVPGVIRREIEDTDALIRALGHSGEIFVRPPYGKRLLGLPLYLRGEDRPVVLWDLEPDGIATHPVRPARARLSIRNAVSADGPESFYASALTNDCLRVVFST